MLAILAKVVYYKKSIGNTKPVKLKLLLEFCTFLKMGLVYKKGKRYERKQNADFPFSYS